MTMIDRWIEGSLVQGTPLCFHADPSNTLLFRRGVVRSHSEEWVAFTEIDSSGQFECQTVLRKAAIIRVSRNDRLGEAMLRSFLASEFAGSADFSIQRIGTLLEYLRTTLRAVRIHDPSGGVTSGFIRSLDEEHLELEVYTRELQYESQEVIALKDIVCITYGGPRHVLLENLVARNRHYGG